eukprot:COSAG02_NODE_25802_length_648_cov_2.041894_1_plen_40_part_01
MTDGGLHSVGGEPSRAGGRSPAETAFFSQRFGPRHGVDEM